MIKVNDRRRVHLEGDPTAHSQVHEAQANEAPEGAIAEDLRGAPTQQHEQAGQHEKIEQLTRELDAAHHRINELARALQAGDRDREEFKQRQSRERERMLDVEKGNVAQTLLEAVDQLDLSLLAADDSPFARGVRLIRESVLKHAESTGIERVELLGRSFDPNLAEATDMEITGVEQDDGKIVAVLKACYQLKGRVIRPGTVKVARFVKPAQA
jgi:molecular chaperone GrpE